MSLDWRLKSAARYPCPASRSDRLLRARPRLVSVSEAIPQSLIRRVYFCCCDRMHILPVAARPVAFQGDRERGKRGVWSENLGRGGQDRDGEIQTRDTSTSKRMSRFRLRQTADHHTHLTSHHTSRHISTSHQGRRAPRQQRPESPAT
jgi:hypothetical protein